MCDFAAQLVVRVMPHVPVRQWVLTVPHGLRAKLAYDPGLTTVVLRQFIAAVWSWPGSPLASPSPPLETTLDRFQIDWIDQP